VSLKRIHEIFLCDFRDFIVRIFAGINLYFLLRNLQNNCRVRFPFEILCFLPHSFLVRRPYLISRFFGRYEVSL
jgi:hypothetical protein